MLDHLLDAGEAHWVCVFISGLEVLISIASSSIEKIKHLGLFVFKVVSVDLELPSHLELPALESGINSIG
jgi:hypothetical protein